MAILSVILALLIEQYRPIGRGKLLYRLFKAYTDWIELHCNAGQFRHGGIGWALAVLPFVLLSWLLFALLYQINPLLAWGFNVAVLYLTMGFRQFSHGFTAISKALLRQRLELARGRLASWTGQATTEMEEEEVARVAIEQGLVDSYRYVFATLFWYVLLPGPSGAVLYRLTSLLREDWGPRAERFDEAFGRFVIAAQGALDWLPIRITAASFALMGDFEDAVHCWREQASAWVNREYGVLLASGAGALGVRLGLPLHQNHTVQFRPELGVGDEADAAALLRAVGLIWRVVVMWVTLLFVGYLLWHF